MKLVTQFFMPLLILFSFLSSPLVAAPVPAIKNSIDGYWRTFDLERNPRSIIKISTQGDRVVAYIVKVLPFKNRDDNSVCVSCTGALKNKPLKGMRIIWDAKKDGDKWTGGTILDTDAGKTYSCNLSLSRDGKILYMHAYIGTPLFGKTVEWQRAQK